MEGKGVFNFMRTGMKFPASWYQVRPLTVILGKLLNPSEPLLICKIRIIVLLT